MLSVAVPEPNRLEIIDIPQPEPQAYEARVRTEVACLCNATDGKLIAGHFPGVSDYPLILGHECVGVVDAVGGKVRNIHVGDRMVGPLLFRTGRDGLHSAWGGFSEYTLGVDHQAMVEDRVADEDHGWREVYEIQTVVDPDIPVEAAVLLCMWREVYGGFDDFSLQPGDDVLVFGAGPVGLSFVKFGRIWGLNYIGVVEPIAFKRDKALSMGADEAFAPGSEELAALAERRHWKADWQGRGKSFDGVIDAVGREEIVNAAVPMVKMGGSVCVYGVLAEDSIHLHKGPGPYNFNVLIHQWPTRPRERAAQGPLCEWLRQGKLDPAEFISHEYPVREVAGAFEAVQTGQVIKALLRF